MNPDIELQKKIEELTTKHNFDAYVKENFGSFETLAIVHGGKKRIVFRVRSLEEAAAVLDSLPATEKEHFISSPSNSNYAHVRVPYKIDISNPCKGVSMYEISYKSNDITIDIEFPVSLMPQFSSVGQRGVTDCEYHYYPGSCMSEIRTIRIRTQVPQCFHKSWFGGSHSLSSESFITEIISFILKNKS